MAQRKRIMVEKDREAVRCIKQNVQHTKMDDRSRVMPMDVMQALRRLEQAGRPFDIIFMDPPYHLDLEERIVPYLLQSSLVKAGSLIIVETALDTDVDYMYELGCEVERIKEYKTNSSCSFCGYLVRQRRRESENEGQENYEQSSISREF